MDMITNTTFKILWNGTKLQEFAPSRAIKQGDLLSPYIFILCLERLSMMLEDATRKKEI